MPSAPCSTMSNPAKARTTPTTWPSARRGTTCRRCSPTAQLSNDAIALNSKLDAQASALSATVVVKDLQGGETRIKAPAAVPVPNWQAAQRANDPGLQLYKERQYAQAEAQFTEALKLRPDFALAANKLGFVARSGVSQSGRCICACEAGRQDKGGVQDLPRTGADRVWRGLRQAAVAAAVRSA